MSTKTDMIKHVQDASKYINLHNTHYLDIFELYVKLNNTDKISSKAKIMFNDFIKLFIALQMFIKRNKWENINTIYGTLSSHKIIFAQIQKKLALTDHYKLDVLTMLVYIKALMKIIKIIYKTESESESKCKSVVPVPVVPVANVDVSDSSSECDKTKPTDVQDITTINNPIDLLKRNKDKIQKISIGLKGISYIFDMINVILSEMQQEYLQKINCYTLYDPSLIVNKTDVEFHNNLLNTSFRQIESLITNKLSPESNFFNDTSDSHAVEVFLDDGRSFTLCTIDNVRIRSSDIINGSKTIIMDIGTRQFSVTFLKDGIDNASVITVMKSNFAEIKSILFAIYASQKSISYWLNIIKKNIN